MQSVEIVITKMTNKFKKQFQYYVKFMLYIIHQKNLRLIKNMESIDSTCDVKYLTRHKCQHTLETIDRVNENKSGIR